MGKRIRAQRLGRGSPTFRARKKGRIKVEYPSYENSTIKAQVVSLMKEPARAVVIAELLNEREESFFMLAPEGMYIGQTIEIGKDASIAIGNVLPLEKIPEGCPIFNIEAIPGDGGKLARSSGSYALVVSKEGDEALVKFPSGKMKRLNVKCRATIGCASGGERKEKPFVKAGKAHHAEKAKGKKSRKVRGVAMNAADHPFGGEQHHAGRSKTTARGAPPGRKVGNIAAKRTGRRKK